MLWRERSVAVPSRYFPERVPPASGPYGSSLKTVKSIMATCRIQFIYVIACSVASLSLGFRGGDGIRIKTRRELTQGP